MWGTWLLHIQMFNIQISNRSMCLSMTNSYILTFNLLSLVTLMKMVLIYHPSRNIQSTVQTITIWYLSRRALHENMFALPVHEQVQGLDNLSMDVAVCLYSEQTKNMRETLQQQPTQGALLWKGLNNNRPHTHTHTHTYIRTHTQTDLIPLRLGLACSCHFLCYRTSIIGLSLCPCAGRGWFTNISRECNYTVREARTVSGRSGFDASQAVWMERTHCGWNETGVCV